MKKLLIGLLIGLMLFSLACASPTTTDADAVATIDGEAITKTDFDRNLAILKYNFIARYGPDYFDQVPEEEMDEMRQNLLDDMINEHFVLREATKEGVAPDEAEVKTYFDQYMEANFGTEEAPTEHGPEIRQFLDENDIDDDFLYQMIKRDFTMREYIMSIQNKYMDEAAQAELFETMVAQVKASHILLPHEQKDQIDELYQTLQEDPGQFAELAKEYSQDGSAQNGGDLGYFVRTEMVPEFNDAAFSAEVGRVTEPIRSDFGYHLILVEQQRFLADMEAGDEEPATIDLARNGILQDTVRLEYFDRLDQWKEAAKIETFELK
ncbi:MAG TPA: hypothetical protein GXZ74_02595 [Tissierellia bacterium]|nr:hypothetical protein [Tissierellia bacterium]